MTPRALFVQTVTAWGLTMFGNNFGDRLLHQASGTILRWHQSRVWEGWVAEQCGLPLPSPDNNEIRVVAQALKEIAAELALLRAQGTIETPPNALETPSITE